MATPLYVRVVDDVTAQIRGGVLKPGDRLPTIQEMAASYEVSPSTVKLALRILEERGLTYGQQGKAIFVRSA